MLKRTKIVCTVGPSTDSAITIDKMIEAGMNVARFNFSHGSHAEHMNRLRTVREASAKIGIPIATMLDTRGPEMRIGKFESGTISLTQGEDFVLTSREILGNRKTVSVSYKNLPNELSPGVKILLADGLISLWVEDISGSDIITRVLNSGEIGSNKRLAVPGIFIQLPPVSEQDVLDISFGIEQDMDFVAASFIQQASDVLAIRKVIEDAGGKMKIIAKIENPSGVENIDSILSAADGIMVARGDLGVEIPAADVPLVQKKLIRKCNAAGKPVITATQMLESMVNNPRPTRAEASDIANAIMDGTDAIMLSGETASGRYPVEAVRTMAEIAVRTEQELEYDSIYLKKGMSPKCSTTDAISHATVQVAHELRAVAIITATESGHTPQMISKYRPGAPVIAVTPNAQCARQVQLLWGVFPVSDKRYVNSDEMVDSSIKAATVAHFIKCGDLVIVTAGLPVGTPGSTNMIRAKIADF